MLAVAVTAALLAILDWQRIWWFLPIAVFSYANALVGYVAVKRRPRGWLRWHIRGMGGSYIALVTALLVVNVGAGLTIAWFLPTIVGAPIIAWTISEVDRGRRPRGYGAAGRTSSGPAASASGSVPSSTTGASTR